MKKRPMRLKNLIMTLCLSLLMLIVVTSSLNSIAEYDDNTDDDPKTAEKSLIEIDKDTIESGGDSINTGDSAPGDIVLHDAESGRMSTYSGYQTELGVALIGGNGYVTLTKPGGVTRQGQLYQLFVDGKMVYCISPGLVFDRNNTVYEASGTAGLSDNDYKRISAAIYFGQRDFDNSATGRAKQAITQAFVWATADGVLGDAELNTYFGDLLSKLVQQYPSFDVVGYYNSLKYSIQKHATLSSFKNSTVELTWNDANDRYEAYLNDTESVADRFNYTPGNPNIVVQKISATQILVYTTSLDFDPGQNIAVNARYSVESGMRVFEHRTNDKFQKTAVFLGGGGYTNEFNFNVRVPVPQIRTTATDAKDGDKEMSVGDIVKIVDVVSYTNLIPNKEYTLNGTLMDKGTGLELLTRDGQKVTATTTFTPSTPTGTVSLEFEFNSSGLWSKEIVVFESLVYKNREVAVHAEINDEAQTVFTPDAPEIWTSAFDAITEESISTPEKDTKIIDKIKYKNLEVGATFFVRGTLVFQDSGKGLTINNQIVVSERMFTPTTVDGIIDMEFNFDATYFKGTVVVVYEEIFAVDPKGEIIWEEMVASHKDVDDLEQTIYFPDIKTTATGEDGGKEIPTDKVTVIVDTVTYSGLEPENTYTLNGVLMDKSTGKPLLTHEGEEVHATTTFTPEYSSGTVTLEFKFDASLLYEKEIVVFESLVYKTKEVAVHADIDDENQTVTTPLKPTVGTTARDSETLDHVAKAGEKVVIIDTVKYTNLEIGKEYTISGILMNYGDATVLKIDGKEITASTTFIAESKDGSVELEFELDATSLKGKTIIVFERMYKDGIEVANHTDINDMEQSIQFPELKTNATNNEKTSQIVSPKLNAIVIDTIEYTNLLVGKTYTVNGVLMDKATGEKLVINGEFVTAETTFTPTTANGVVEMVFRFDASALSGKQVVVFEKVFLDGKEVATHEDINDEGQTVSFREVPPLPSTGVQSNNTVLFGVLITIAGIGVTLFGILKKQKRVRK